VTRDVARDLSGVVGELASLNEHAAVEAALVAARRRVWLNEGRER
jgi:hypothetical protein